VQRIKRLKKVHTIRIRLKKSKGTAFAAASKPKMRLNTIVVRAISAAILVFAPGKQTDCCWLAGCPSDPAGGICTQEVRATKGQSRATSSIEVDLIDREPSDNYSFSLFIFPEYNQASSYTNI
jgi:hypothetical protein